MDGGSLEARLRRLKCPRCSKPYAMADVLSLDAAGSGHRVDLGCGRCGLRVRLQLPAARRRRSPARRPHHPAGRVRTREPVSDEDVRRMRRLLAEVSGSVQRLLDHLV